MNQIDAKSRPTNLQLRQRQDDLQRVVVDVVPGQVERPQLPERCEQPNRQRSHVGHRQRANVGDYLIESWLVRIGRWIVSMRHYLERWLYLHQIQLQVSAQVERLQPRQRFQAFRLDAGQFIVRYVQICEIR